MIRLFKLFIYKFEHTNTSHRNSIFTPNNFRVTDKCYINYKNQTIVHKISIRQGYIKHRNDANESV